MATAPLPKIKDQFDATTVTLQSFGFLAIGTSIGMSGLVLWGYTKPEDKKDILIGSFIILLIGITLSFIASKRRDAIRAKEQAALEAMVPKN